MTLETWLRENGLSALGGNWRVHIETALRFASCVPDERRREIVFRLPEANRELLLPLLRQWAQGVIPAAVLEKAKALGLDEKCRRVSVRDQSGRWGSCSSSGTLSLNWRLVLLPWPLHDYVILHELGHFAHMNHSGEFWDFLHAHNENAGRLDRTLMKLSTQVMLLGR